MGRWVHHATAGLKLLAGGCPVSAHWTGSSLHHIVRPVLNVLLLKADCVSTGQVCADSQLGNQTSARAV